ncbi:hypothetical protein E4A41_00035 [Micrococcus endophyticus]|nr:hypothetical protein E4A41_00035 [Micrococcus endophyticus]
MSHPRILQLGGDEFQQVRVVVQQRPVLAEPQARCQPGRVGTGAGADVDDVHGAVCAGFREVFGERIEQGG